MKFFIAIALLAAVASAKFILPAGMPANQVAEIEEIIAAINSPNTDPATAAMLEQMLHDILGIAEYHPIDVGPAFVDEYHPIDVGPALIDFDVPESAVTDTQPRPPKPVRPKPPKPVAPAPSSSPLVQIVVNVKNAQDVGGSPVAVEGLEPPFPEIVAEMPSPIPDIPEIIAVLPSPVPDVPPTPVQVVEIPTPVEPVIVSPIVVEPVQVAPEILN